MDHNPDRLCVWPGYFDMKQSRRSGRRVPKDASVLKPDLEGLFRAAREVGLRKIKREEHVSHPKRPHGKEGRLWVSASGAKESIGAASKRNCCNSSAVNGGKCSEMPAKKSSNRLQRAKNRGPSRSITAKKHPATLQFQETLQFQKSVEVFKHELITLRGYF